MPQIVVILPVHNVAALLERCFASLCAQTYREWRAIFVEDGSTDGSDGICDEIVARDARFSVIHRTNGGVAAARNTGVKAALEAGADYVAFIDPDDWVLPAYLETLVAGVRAGAKLSAVGYQDVSATTPACPDASEPTRELSSEDFWFVSNILSSVVWGKLIAREIIARIKFPEGRVHEDETVLPELVFSAEKVAYSPAKLYCYWHRETSITRGDNAARWTRASLDHIAALETQIDYFAKHGLDKPLAAARRLLVTYCTKAITELGAVEMRPLLRRTLADLKWTKDFDEEYFRAAYPMEVLKMKMKKLIKKGLKAVLPYGLVRVVQKRAEARVVEPEGSAQTLEFPVTAHPEGKNLFLVDEHIPAYDRDAGGRQITIYVRILTQMGYKVYLLGEDAYRREPYATEFEKLGVVVLSGEAFSPANRAAWFQKNGRYLDYAFLHRPGSAAAYLPLVRMYAPQAKVIFFGADLAQVRLQREYEITKRPELLEEIRVAKLQEDFLYVNSDVNLCVGAAETKFVAEKYAERPVHEIPLFIYETFLENTPAFGARKDLLFVGGFNHRPNRDAVEWFLKEIFPKIKAEIPEIRFNIVGSNMPEEIKALADANVVIHGFVSDETLRGLYDSCRVTVAPLRYGAGVKGKIVDALYYRSVVVTTSIGAEGIPHEPLPFAIADEAGCFAKKVIEVYTDESAWTASRTNALEVLKKTYGVVEAQKLLTTVFSKKGR